MIVAVTAGLGGRLMDLFGACARWERSSGRRLAMIFQLGDLPLCHDFSRAAGRSGPPSPEVADAFHHRRPCPYPLVFLAGEKDDLSLLVGASGIHLARRSAGDRPSGGITPPRELSFIAAGELLRIGDECEAVAVAGLSAFGPAVSSAAGKGDVRRPDQAPSRRAAIRSLFAAPPGSVDLLLSHDAVPRPAPPPGAKSRDGAARGGHPGDLFLKVLDSIQPSAACYGHAAAFRVERRGGTVLVGLPPCRREAAHPVVVALDTAARTVEIMG